jgi:hypothetical protein
MLKSTLTKHKIALRVTVCIIAVLLSIIAALNTWLRNATIYDETLNEVIKWTVNHYVPQHQQLVEQLESEYSTQDGYFKDHCSGHEKDLATTLKDARLIFSGRLIDIQHKLGSYYIFKVHELWRDADGKVKNNEVATFVRRGNHSILQYEIGKDYLVYARLKGTYIDPCTRTGLLENRKEDVEALNALPFWMYWLVYGTESFARRSAPFSGR